MFFGATLCGNPAVECQKLRVFCEFFLARCTPLRENEGRVSKIVFFCDFGVPESVLRIVLTIRFATYGRFLKRAKMSENRQKTSKTDGFMRFFHVRSKPLRESGRRVSKTEGFLRFWCARICPNDLFCYIRPSPRLSRGAPRWFQTSLRPVWNPLDGFRMVSEGSETHLFLKKKIGNGRMISFESYGGLKLPEIGPDNLFCYIRLLQGHPEASSDGIRGVSEGSETVWFQRGFSGVWNRVVSDGFQRGLKPCGFSEGFQRGLKPCGFRGVSEGSETVWFQRGFRGVWNRVVSEGFQRGVKPCGFRGLSEGSETVWFQRGFRGVWNRVVSEGFQRNLKPCGFRGVSEGSETVGGFRGVSEGSETVGGFREFSW